jgi:hypothetical protein
LIHEAMVEDDQRSPAGSTNPEPRPPNPGFYPVLSSQSSLLLMYNSPVLLFHQFPVIVQVVDQPTPQTTVVDVLLGTFGLIGVLLLSAVVLGALLGGVLVAMRMRRARRGLDRDVTRTRLGLGPPALTFEPGDPTGP